MTVMIPTYFGMPQSLIRNGRLKSLSGAAIKLYVALWHESERNRTRELTRTASQLRSLTGVHRNSIANAQRELVEAGLVTAEPFGEKGFVYQLCDPETGKPWPGAPDAKVEYVKRLVPGNPASVRPATNGELAGTSFPFGANASAQDSLAENTFRSRSVAASSGSAVRWEDLGNA